MNVNRRWVLGSVAGLAAATSMPLPALAGKVRGGDWRSMNAVRKKIRLPRFPARNFSISDFDAGASAIGATRRAIDACHTAGGGRVLVPVGIWHLEGPVHLKSNVELHLSKGAVLRSSGDPSHYLPVVFTRWEGTECYSYSPFIYAKDCENIGLTGAGLIDGGGKANFLPWRERQKIEQDRLRQMGIDGVPVDRRVFGEGSWLRPHFVQFGVCIKQARGTQYVDGDHLPAL